MWISTATAMSARAAMPPSDDAIRAVLVALAAERGGDKSFCPSDAARRIGGDWRAMMPEIRRVASEMQEAGLLRATQKGAPVDPRRARGPIRLRGV